MDYLDFWSSPNVLAVEATPEFYAPRVAFYGREISARALFDEKRRFLRRWPVRSYAPRVEATQTKCDPEPGRCLFRTVFDFTAMNPRRGRRSEGVAALRLEISMAGGRPVIVAETSKVLRRGRTRSGAGREAADDPPEVE